MIVLCSALLASKNVSRGTTTNTALYIQFCPLSYTCGFGYRRCFPCIPVKNTRQGKSHYCYRITPTFATPPALISSSSWWLVLHGQASSFDTMHRLYLWATVFEHFKVLDIHYTSTRLTSNDTRTLLTICDYLGPYNRCSIRSGAIDGVGSSLLP